MVELKGSLGGIGLPAIAQLIGELRHSGTLQLARDGITTGTLAFDDGRLVAAECGDVHGLQAVAACALDLGNTDFIFLEDAPPPEHSLDLGPAELERVLSRLTNRRYADATHGIAEPASDVRAESVCPSSTPAEPREAELAHRRPRGILLIAGGAVVGLVLVGLLLLIALRALKNSAGPTPSVTTGEVAFEPVATASPAPAVVAQQPALTLVAQQPVATLAPARPPSPTMPPRAGMPTVAPGSFSPMAERFASGPADNWLENPPYAGWSDGAYRLQSKDATRFVAVGVPVDQVLTDVIVSATFRKTGGPPGGGYGLIVRDQGPEPRDGVNQQFNAYVLETGDLGEYGVWRRDGDHWVDMVPWTTSPNVRSGGSPNDLSVKAIGNQLTLTVNGADLATVQDDTFEAGGVGLFIGGDYNEVALDRFSLGFPR